MTVRYQPGGVTVAIGRSQDISIPTRVFRGRATCMHFDTDKSFLLPPSMPGVRNIVQFYARHSGMTMLINGHTDGVGDAQYNVQLSVERASAVAAYLLAHADEWLTWYHAASDSKRWGVREDQSMLSAVLDPQNAPYYAGPISGVPDADTRDATSRFQTDQGLRVDGMAGDETRRALITQYMALDGTSLPSDATLVIHGCGKFHPIDATTGADAGNRRVEIFLFDGPVSPPPTDPCPAPGCAQYAEWVAEPEEDIDLCKPQLFDLVVVVEDSAVPPQPIPAAGVQLSGPTPGTGTTDDTGVVSFRQLDPGSYSLVATKTGFDPVTLPIRPPPPRARARAARSSARRPPPPRHRPRPPCRRRRAAAPPSPR
jgi:outer membrane protein OmpA-like peptidoglycan-associated protein